MMHCPGCGNESTVDQKFCRKCGFNLEPVGKLFVPDNESAQVELTKAERESLLVRHMFRWMSWGGIALLIGVVLLVVSKQVFPSPLIALPASFFLIAGIVMASYGVFSAIGRGTKLPLEKAPKSPNELRPADTTNELDVARIPVPSVTERTTQLIEAKRSDSPTK
ncbi:MAG TPA: zinc ribbon domain-containing protein [Pyrinomonadaceae bacterium]|nr:zinc ribbon domain-containing protein [Pyrinomonadaceae bacterium]